MMTRDLKGHVAADAAPTDYGFLTRTDLFDEVPYPFGVVAHLAEGLPVHRHRFRVTWEIRRYSLEARPRHDRHEVMPLQRAGPAHVDADKRNPAAAHVVIGPRAVNDGITTGDFLGHDLFLDSAFISRRVDSMRCVDS